MTFSLAVLAAGIILWIGGLDDGLTAAALYWLLLLCKGWSLFAR